MTTFYIIRHGQTEWNEKGLLQGHKDSPLTEVGINQAKRNAESIRDINFDAIISSDIGRAKKTAEIISQNIGLGVSTDSRLRERSFGKFEGRPFTIFQDELKDAVLEFEKLSDSEKKKHHYLSMESDEELINRVIDFLQETTRSYPNQNFLLVTHSATITYLLLELGFFTYENKSNFTVSQDSYIVIESDGKNFKIKDTRGIIKKLN